MFLAGILISKTPQAGIVSQKVKEVGEAFFIPIFFATIGLSVSISSVYQQLPLLIPLIVSIIAIKLICASLPLTLFGYSWKESLRIGSGMVSLSEMAIVILGIGLISQVLDVTLYSMLAVAFIIIDILSPLILNFAFKFRR
jgi:Kef-type K+ transport system membrane component KefB